MKKPTKKEIEYAKRFLYIQGDIKESSSPDKKKAKVNKERK